MSAKGINKLNIEHLPKNVFMLLFDLKSGECEDKKERQTIKNDDLSLSVHPTLEILNLWEDFKKVVKFIKVLYDIFLIQKGSFKV